MRILPFAVILGACTSFDSIERGVCGNGLIEPGEDCDSRDPSCVACAVTCTTAADCPNTGYACGVDGRCHAPGGGLGHPVQSGSFESSQFAITDVDQDGVGDAVGVSRTSVVVRYGEASGALSNVTSMVTPSQTGPAAFGRLDDDTSTDITITTEDGIVAYTSPYGTLSPLDVQSFLGNPNTSPLDMRMMFGITKLVVGGFVVDPMSGKVAYIVVDFIDSSSPRVGLPCGIVANGSDFDKDDVDVYQASNVGSIATDYVVSLRLGSGASKQVCVLAIHKDNLATLPTVTDITPPAAPMMAKKPVLVDLTSDGDECPGLVDTDGGPGALRNWDGQMGIGHCTLKPAALGGNQLPPVPTTMPGATVLGHAPLDPSIAGYSPDLLLVSDGLYVLSGGASPAFGAIYRSPRKLAHVATGDLDKDGGVDIVLSGAGEDDLDVLYRYGVVPAFQLYRIDTASEVTTITIDDFDGNSWDDIAYTELIADHQRMMIAYGTTDRPTDPIQVGVFGGVLSVVKLAFGDSVDLLDTCTDLGLLVPGSPPALSFLHGSPQRTMLPYFDPRSNTGGSTSIQGTTVFRGSVIGNFAPTVGGGAEHADLVGIAIPSAAGTTAGDKVRAWAAAGNGSSVDDTTSDGVVVNGFAACTLNGNGVCIEDATYLRWPVSDTKDVALAIDHAQPPHAAVVDPWSAANGSVTATTASQLISAVPAGTAISTLHAADVDGDGNDDLIATFAPTANSTGHGAVLVCSVDGTGMPSTCTDLVPTIVAAEPSTTTCLDAAPGHLGYGDPFTTPSAAADVIVLCNGDGATLHRVSYSGGAYHDQVLAHSASTLTQLQVGDVTGDGVDDVVAVVGDAGSQSLVVFPQCTSRDLACLQSASSASEAP